MDTIGILGKEALELLRGMVAIPSVSFHEAGVCSYISDVLSGRGISHHLEKNNLEKYTAHEIDSLYSLR